MARRWSCRAAWKIQGRKGVSAHSTLCTSLDSVIPDARGLLEGQRLSRRATLGAWGVGYRDCSLLSYKLGLGGLRDGEGVPVLSDGALCSTGTPCAGVNRLEGPLSSLPLWPGPTASVSLYVGSPRCPGPISMDSQVSRCPCAPVLHPPPPTAGSPGFCPSCFGISSALSYPDSRDLVAGPQAACVHRVSDIGKS